MKTAAWKVLLTDVDVRRWYENLQRGSEHTADETIRTLNRYLNHDRHRPLNLTPRSLLDFARRDQAEVENQLLDFIGALESQRHAPGYISNHVKAVKSWLAHNGIQVRRKFKIRGSDTAPTLEDEQVPGPEEVRAVLNNATPRTAVSISLMSMSGVRPQVLGNKRGTDGLRVKDLPEMVIQGLKVSFLKVPTMVVVRADLSKAGHRYFTFLGEEGCELLKDYLEKRLAQGEQLGPDTPIIRVKPGFEAKARSDGAVDYAHFIVTNNVEDNIRDAFRPRFKWRPYVLRCYFDTRLLQAEHAGRVPPSFRAFFMGHKGDIEARYTTNKGRLPPDLVESMRQAYQAACTFLETAPRTHENPVLELIQSVLEGDGRNPEEIKALRLEAKTNAELVAMLRHHINRRAQPVAPAQRIIPTAGLQQALAEGWTFRAVLPNEQAIVELAGGGLVGA